ncbi:hypothetical protein NCS52_00770400 [Fusarium sp. LHS14.1]|nr:hypothetical protein NCS52_00770400 [Fusarium sp. LHS14.1]
MDPYSHSSTYTQDMLPVYDEDVLEPVDPTQPTEEIFIPSYQYSSSSALETPPWPSTSTYQDPSEETPQSAEVPSAYSYPSSSSQNLAESSQTANLDNTFSCLFSGCNAKPFKRNADLQRHYKNVHNPDSTKEAHFCDHLRCTRVSEPFRRRDHLRDHLRGYHREDIGKRGTIANEESLEDRYYSNNWWRCSRCLIRVYVAKDKFKCPECKGLCEPKRVEKRMEKRQEKRRRH